MKSIGETLRRERLRQNLELGQISDVLKISSRMLAAIEDEKFDRLPGGVFSRSFVRQYAQLLGLDAGEIGRCVDRVLDPTMEDPRGSEIARQPAAPVRPKATPPKPQSVPARSQYAPVRQQAQPLRQQATPLRQQASALQLPPVDNWTSVGGRRFSWKSPLPALGMVVVAMLGCAGVYAWWSRNRHPVAAPEPVAVAAAHLRPAAVQPPPPPPAMAPAEPAVAAEPELNPNAAVRVELTAAEPAWVSVKSDGRYLFSGVLEANQSRVVDANTTVLLVIGNAGGVSIQLNGKPIGSVGPKGQVRNVQLTSGGFEIVPSRPAASVAPM